MYSNNGFFDDFGGKYVAEVLRRPLDELEKAFNEAMKDETFLKELETIKRLYWTRNSAFICKNSNGNSWWCTNLY